MSDPRPPNPHLAKLDGLASLSVFDALIDVRSPAEFADDHVPGAINCPVLDDLQRAEVGTLYKQVSPFAARKLGASLVSANIAAHLKHPCFDQQKHWHPLVYCWRGGQRSGAMTTVLRQIGWNAQQLEGGYKAYRRQVLEQLARLPTQFRFVVIGGATGSAKSRVLHALGGLGAQTLDLESLAAHKGSVLGLEPGARQPSQKMFESHLRLALSTLDPQRPVFVEAESRKIGVVHLPETLITTMRGSACVAIEAPLTARVEFLLRDYDYFLQNADALCQRLTALIDLRGKETVAHWSALAQSGCWPQLVEELLSRHYDPLYRKSQHSNYTDFHASRCLQANDLGDVEINRLAGELLQFQLPDAKDNEHHEP